MSNTRNDILMAGDGSVAYISSLQCGVIMGGTGGKTVEWAMGQAGKKQPPAPQPEKVKPKKGKAAAADQPATDNNGPAPFTLAMVDTIALWGLDNLFPQMIIELAERSTELPALLDWKSRAAQGKDVLPYHRVFNPDTKQLEEVPITDPDILSFFTSIPTQRYIREAYNDFFWFWNVFPDMIKNVDGQKIAYLGAHKAPWCRWHLTNDQGIIQKCTVSSHWPNGNYGDSRYFKEFDVINPYQWDVADALKADTGTQRFVYPLSYPSPGKFYYQLAPWDGIRTSGWLKLAAVVPEFKEAYMLNQITVKFLITIPNNYWPAIYKNWDEMTEEQQVAKKQQKLQEIEKQLTGPAKAGKTIMIEVGYDQAGNLLPGWTITRINDSVPDGAYLEDSMEASAHLLRALGLDAVLVGDGPGRDLNAGGGADKLIAFNMYCALQEPYRKVVLEPFYFIAQYNGWMERYPLFMVKTVDASPQALDVSKKVSNSVQQVQTPQASPTQPQPQEGAAA